jgi:hypothetical protein
MLFIDKVEQGFNELFKFLDLDISITSTKDNDANQYGHNFYFNKSKITYTICLDDVDIQTFSKITPKNIGQKFTYIDKYIEQNIDSIMLFSKISFLNKKEKDSALRALRKILSYYKEPTQWVHQVERTDYEFDADADPLYCMQSGPLWEGIDWNDVFGRVVVINKEPKIGDVLCAPLFSTGKMFTFVFLSEAHKTISKRIKSFKMLCSDKETITQNVFIINPNNNPVVESKINDLDKKCLEYFIEKRKSVLG